MEFNVGAAVVHWTYGLGKIVAVEERALAGQKTLYYVVQINDLTVWVPVDEKAKMRLRPPTSQNAFKKLFKILSEPGKSLSEDRHERKVDLHQKLQDGNVESLCTVIRDLSSYQHKKALNDDDKVILRRASTSLLGEWGYSFSVSVAQAEQELRGLLRPPPEGSRG
jgi:RNA polymerase-interacting CarD/CdnL/TRCF family regulator